MIKDYIKDQYEYFLNVCSTEGVEWIYFFKDIQNTSLKYINLLSSDDLKKETIKYQAHKLSNIFPELGPFYLAYDIQKFYQDEKNNLEELSLRSFLKNGFLFYPTDKVFCQIFNEKGDLVINITQSKSIKEINFFTEEINQLKKYQSIVVKLKLDLSNGKSSERLFHEEKSLLNDSVQYLNILLSKLKNEPLFLKLKKENNSFYNYRLNLLGNNEENLYKIELFLKYKSVQSYERFIQFFNLSKYNNEYLENLDKYFNHDLKVCQKHKDRVSYKYI